MEKETEVPTVESEAHRLVKSNFRKVDSGSSAIHVYKLRTHWMIQKKKNISAANLSAVLREVEDNEREKSSAEEIKLWLGNIG